ncbi:MAG: beta-lactamase family protein [Alphaproteobacteria bacterium]|nr:beta-lactamase family protein [Alphaproteobacteria bacterium]MBU1517168.1 beta-lactamase family protein [Alphaproteobacteria bacterium]MBU2096499.1 beta-lactamase family protein [Alphaproteobacteria bacterium]MBU2151651.1 beta-lactamase family protein [Alphaproteobacteria bacterium]MBU2305471.1 beta-lactamase family protein [Alphaproteobacteria bacterium]
MRLMLGALAAAAWVASAHAATDVGNRQTWLSPTYNAAAFTNMEELFPSRRVAAGGKLLALTPAALPLVPTYMVGGQTRTVDDFMAGNQATGLLILKGQTILYERYARGADAQTRFVSFSMGKSIVSTLIGEALAEGKIASLDDPIAKYLPDVKGGAYEIATIRDLLEMLSGTSFDEGYARPGSPIARFIGVFAANQGGLYDFARAFPSAGKPGTKFNYASADTEVLGALLTKAIGEPISDYLSRKVWAPMGAESDARWLLDAPGSTGHEVAAGGVLARLRDYGRFGLLFARKGELNGQRIVPSDWVAAATRPNRPQVAYGALGTNTPYGYGYQWWLAPGGEGVFVAIGIYGQYLIVDPKRDLVIVKTAAWPAAGDGPRAEETLAFYKGVADALDRRGGK